MPFPMAIIVCRFTYIEPSAVGEHWYNTMYLRDMINSANLAIVGYISIMASDLHKFVMIHYSRCSREHARVQFYDITTCHVYVPCIYHCNHEVFIVTPRE